MHDTIVSGLSHYLQIKEAHRLNPELSKIQLKDPLVVIGLPRSGTTHLHRLLALAPDSTYLPMWEHFYPVPPRKGLDFRRLGLKIQFNFWKYFANRFGLDSVHYVRPDLPDECTFSLRFGGSSHLFWSMAPVYDYLDWLSTQSTMEESYKTYRLVLQLIQARNPNKRIILKCPSHALNLKSLTKIIPEARLVFTHRAPRALIGSEASLIARLQATSAKTKIDWRRTVKANARKNFLYSQKMVEFSSQHPAAKIFHAPYSKLIKEPKALVEAIHEFFDVEMTETHQELLSKYLSQNKQHSHGKHNYSHKNTGLTELEINEGLKDYVKYFAEHLPKKEQIVEHSRSIAEYDVIVIGAGLSGLAAANRVLEDRPTARVLVMEANKRVGGRLKSVTASNIGVEADLGGAFVGPTQDRIIRLADRFGIDSYKVFNNGNVMFHNTRTGKVVRGSISIPPLSAYALLDFNAILVKFENMAAAMDTSDPSKIKFASELDNLSVKSWIMQNSASDEVKKMFPRVVDTIICESSSNVSMLYWLWYAKSGDTLKRIMDVANGAQERKFKGGAAQIPKKLAENILGMGGTLLLNKPVAIIDQSGDSSVKVTDIYGKTAVGKRLIVAVPPHLYSKIQWKPELPSKKLAVSQNFHSGNCIKTVVFYKNAWWKEHGQNGQIWDTRGPVVYCLDDSQPGSRYPSIMGFILADDAQKWTSKTSEERKEAILQQYALLFQTKDALEAVDYVEQDWNKEIEYVRGAAVSMPKIGTFLETSKFIRHPFQRVHFAGTELAIEWAGYMDGAVQSGERAADEVLRAQFASDLKPRECMPPLIQSKTAAPCIFERILSVGFSQFVTLNKILKGSNK